MIRKFLVLSAILLLAGTSRPAYAETMSMEEMQKQLEALAMQVQKLSAIVEKQAEIIERQNTRPEGREAMLMEQSEILGRQPATTANLPAIAPAAGSVDSAVRISMNPMPKIESADGLYSFQPFGRVHMDYTFFDDDSNRDHPDSADLRRARLGFKGALGEDFNYKIEMDFAREGVAFKEVALNYSGLAFADFSIGHIKPYFGMQQNISSNYLQFLERAAVTNALTRDEELGFSLHHGGDVWSLGLGVFNEDGGNNNPADDEAWALDGRATLSIINREGRVLHIGAGGSYRVPTARTESVIYAARVTGVSNNLVNTGAIANVDHEQVYNAELAGVLGPLSFMGEYIISNVERDGSVIQPDPDFDGWYAQAGYFLTGETRPYIASKGTWGRVKPLRPFSLKDKTWGAWELAARYENLDLNDAASGVTGGELDAWTVGINWHLTPYIRLMANYIAVETDGNAEVPFDDPNVVNIRAQWDF